MTAFDPFVTRDYGPVRFLHRLNPLAKIAAPLPAMVALIFTRDVVIPAIFVVVAVALLAVGAKLSRRAWVAILVGIPLIVAFTSATFALWVDPQQVSDSVVVAQVGEFRLHSGAILIGAATSLRLIAIFVLALLSGLTSTGPDLVRAMVQQLKVPYRVGYTALAAYRFVPRFGHELEVIRSAHRVRGVEGGRGPIATVRRTLGYAVPLLAGAIRHAERVALAMDSRGFGAFPTRTERHLVPFRVRDGVFIVLFIAASVAVFAVRLS